MQNSYKRSRIQLFKKCDLFIHFLLRLLDWHVLWFCLAGCIGWILCVFVCLLCHVGLTMHNIDISGFHRTPPTIICTDAVTCLLVDLNIICAMSHAYIWHGLEWAMCLSIRTSPGSWLLSNRTCSHTSAIPWVLVTPIQLYRWGFLVLSS